MVAAAAAIWSGRCISRFLFCETGAAPFSDEKGLGLLVALQTKPGKNLLLSLEQGTLEQETHAWAALTAGD